MSQLLRARLGYTAMGTTTNTGNCFPPFLRRVCELELVLSVPFRPFPARYGGLRGRVGEHAFPLGCAADSLPATARVSTVFIEAAIAHLVKTKNIANCNSATFLMR